MITPVNKGHDISIMIWAAIFGNDRSECIIMSRDSEAAQNGYSARSYLKILQEELPKIWQPGMSLVQDNASIHTAKICKKWLSDEAIPVVD